ncbi:hypothetical protein D5086_021629 [Populus alba]|uniref:Uncharacterized protein n=1 Tax=Populus alba TaxID=43335 RepID=A0ACC4BD96_POPAL
MSCLASHVSSDNGEQDLSDAANHSGESGITYLTVNVAHENKKQSAPVADLIVLSDDEKEDASAAASKRKIQNLNCSIWNCMSPNGMKTGLWSMLLLKEWSDC